MAATFDRRSHGVALLALFSLALLLLTSPAGAQTNDQYAIIAGTVWSADQHVAPGVVVKVRRAGEKKARWQALSDRRGEFAIRLPAGAQDYVVWADIKLPKGTEPPEAKVHIVADERADIVLHLP